MSSLVSGFEYDVFISYRQNDNHSGWITEFVKHLKEELASSIKDPVSVYFDSHPQDGLLELHNVDKSLEGKLKCLVFIPILSQTYCDPKSFAWQNEFIPFNAQASGDRLGLDIRLANGNVISRILPVRIHELDHADLSLIEGKLSGRLRAIDFIYREAGVNRPLLPDDAVNTNLNKTQYRNQVNKVANAVKDIVVSLTQSGDAPKINKATEVSVAVPSRKKLALVLATIVAVLAGGYALLNFIGSNGSSGTVLDKSIAVLPFANLSNDPEQEYFSDGITDQIITNLSHLSGVKVIARTSVMKYKGSIASIPEIGSDLNVNYVLEGSVQKSGGKLRINAQLIRVADNFHEWAEIFDRDMTDIFMVQDDISQTIATALGNELTPDVLRRDRPDNPEAYEYYMKARHIAFTQYYFNQRENIKAAFDNARAFYEKAIELDSGFALAYAGLADLYDELRNHDIDGFPEDLNKLRKGLARKAFSLDPNSGFVNNVKAYVMFNNERPPLLDSAHYYLRRAHELEPEDDYLVWCVGTFYQDRGLNEEALPYLIKAVGISPNDPKMQIALGVSYLALGKTADAKVAFENGKRLGGETGYYHKYQVITWMLLTGQTYEAQQFLATHKELDPAVWQKRIDAATGKYKPQASDTSEFFINLFSKRLLVALEIANRGLNENTSRYEFFVHNEWWTPIRSHPRFLEVLEMARVNHLVVRKKYGFN